MRQHPEDLSPQYALAYLRYRAGERQRPRPAHYGVDGDALAEDVALEIRRRIDGHIAAATRSPRPMAVGGRFSTRIGSSSQRLAGS